MNWFTKCIPVTLCVALCSCGTWKQLSPVEKVVVGGGVVAAGAITSWYIYDNYIKWLDCDKHCGVVQAALKDTEQRLGDTFDKSGKNKIKVEWKPFTHRHNGVWVLENGHIGEAHLSGHVTKLVLGERDGKVNYENIVHECAHAVLHSRGVEWEKHHSIMRKSGVQVGGR